MLVLPGSEEEGWLFAGLFAYGPSEQPSPQNEMQGRKQRTGREWKMGTEQFELFAQQKGTTMLG